MNEAVKAGHNGADRRSSYDRPVAFVLEGGGALGSDQEGDCERIAEAGYVPTWVAKALGRTSRSGGRRSRSAGPRADSGARLTVEAAPWLAPPPPGLGARTFDVSRDRVARWIPAHKQNSFKRSGG
ncbi:MAG: hypothetical protein JO355_05195 [Planctomycetaceae bacterium]|nr:hypothetical protein [Planctomycetaceae bacterium]